MHIISLVQLISFIISTTIATNTTVDSLQTIPGNNLETVSGLPNRDTVVNYAFGNGEELTFKIRYGFIRAGTAKMKVFTKIYDNNRKVYHLQTIAKSASAFNWIYEVNDTVNSYVDYNYFYPVHFEKKLREGGYRVDLLTDYFPNDSLAKIDFIRYNSDMKVKKHQSFEMTVPSYVQDILSSFYYIRIQDLEVGNTIFLSNHEKKKVYDLKVIVHPREIVEVEAGTFLCVVVEPVLKGVGLFKSEGGLKVWLTDDEKKIPVQMKTEVLVGSITTELIKIKGISGPIKARIK